MRRKKINLKNSYHISSPVSKNIQRENIDQFIHVSALGVENAIDSDYAISKTEGEKKLGKILKIQLF